MKKPKANERILAQLCDRFQDCRDQLLDLRLSAERVAVGMLLEFPNCTFRPRLRLETVFQNYETGIYELKLVSLVKDPRVLVFHKTVEGGEAHQDFSDLIVEDQVLILDKMWDALNRKRGAK